MTKILFLCHGNICRSPMAQFVFQYMVDEAGLSDRFEIDSAAMTNDEIGRGPHHGTVSKMHEVGIPVLPHKARKMTKEDYDYYDLLIIMDEENQWMMDRMIPEDKDGKIHMLLEYTGENRDVADPWFTHNFDVTYDDVSRGCRALLDSLL